MRWCLNVAGESGQFETIYDYWDDEGHAKAEALAKASQDELVNNGLICGVSAELFAAHALTESEYDTAVEILQKCREELNGGLTCPAL